jgi:tRNA A-37 threonylcarbamoyl transferase component Bud32/mono/diheme cytochrome c family protein
MFDPVAVAAQQLSGDWHARYEPVIDDAWWHFDPISNAPVAQQGWKIHVSATPDTAERTLRRVAAIVMPLGLRWKVARSLHHVVKLCAPPTPVSQVGKFITVYVEDEREVPALAGRLHAATRGLGGPVVPSDRRYAPGSSVYLRYGAFAGRRTYTGRDQLCEWCLVDPTGRAVVDHRAPGRYRPDWVAEPPLPPPPAPPSQRGHGLFGRGIEVSAALGQSARGIVIRGTWRGRSVVVKEARIGTVPDGEGRDARDRLRNEWELLRRLSGSGLAPEPLAYFTEEDNAYLVQELLPGNTLRQTVTAADYLGRPKASWLLDLCRAVADLVTGLRGHGVEPRDLTPDNIMVHEGRCTAIDLELWGVASSHESPFAGWTPGYARPYRGAPDADDVEFAVAAVTHFVLTGIDPYLAPSEDVAGHIDDILAAFGPDDAELVASELAMVRARLGAPALLREAAASPGIDETLAAAVEAGVELVRRTEWDEPVWPWPRAWRSDLHHAACFYAGASGIARYYLDLWEATGDREWVRHAEQLVEWTFVHHPYVPKRTPPGLHFGVGALPWLAADLANLVDPRHSPALRAEAVRLAAELVTAEPGSWDLTHGWSGIGLAQLATHLATGDDECARSAQRIAYRVLGDAVDADGLLVWPKNGAHYYGLAHGSAGVGQFLLAAGAVADDPVLANAALDVARALVSRGVPTGEGGLGWLPGPVDNATLWTHWCNGAAGVGTFLLAAATFGADDELAGAARQCGRAISRSRAFGSCNRCHGLAGDGDYLLDLVRAGHGEEFLDGANRIGHKLAALAFRNGFAWKWPNNGEDPRPAYMTGYLGAHTFRLRLAGLIERPPLTIPVETLAGEGRRHATDDPDRPPAGRPDPRRAPA